MGFLLRFSPTTVWGSPSATPTNLRKRCIIRPHPCRVFFRHTASFLLSVAPLRFVVIPCLSFMQRFPEITFLRLPLWQKSAPPFGRAPYLPKSEPGFHTENVIPAFAVNRHAHTIVQIVLYAKTVQMFANAVYIMELHFIRNVFPDFNVINIAVAAGLFADG